jgi:L,D-peptidoglycan transpeptidase YkuD (ErfK/YbiS/YcfS/YnhG family)
VNARAAARLSGSEYRAISAASARRERPPQGTRLGGDIFLHGGGAHEDWTLGCIAIDDGDIEQLFRTVPVRTPISIRP